MTENSYVVFFDGVCGLCNGFINFLLYVDKRKILRFASLQSDYATTVLSAENTDLRSIVYLRHGKVLTQSTAILQILSDVNPLFAPFRVVLYVPRSVRDAVYSFVARHRYSVFGKRQECRIASEAERALFLD